MGKKIIVLNGSPRSRGNTAALIREFVNGAEAAGGSVTVFELQRMKIHGCLGCLAGGGNPESPCTQKDDMDRIYPVYKESDVVVFASPMYYWAFSGQLKIVIDRLFAVTEANHWQTPEKSCAMLMAAEGSGRENDAPVLDYYQSLVKFLNWQDLGHLIAGGVLKAGDIEGKTVLEDARSFGASIA